MKECGRDNEVEVYMHGCLNDEPYLILCFSLFWKAFLSECCLMMFNGSSNPDVEVDSPEAQSRGKGGCGRLARHSV